MEKKNGNIYWPIATYRSSGCVIVLEYISTYLVSLRLLLTPPPEKCSFPTVVNISSFQVLSKYCTLDMGNETKRNEPDIYTLLKRPRDRYVLYCTSVFLGFLQ